MFIVVHQKDTDKIFSYNSNSDFNLEAISSLLLEDTRRKFNKMTSTPSVTGESSDA